MATSGFAFDSFFRSLDSKFDSGTKKHLQNVYSCLSMSTLAAAIGGYVHLFTNLFGAGLLTFFASIGLLLTLMSTPDDGKNQAKRLGYLLGFAFFSGINCGPLLQYAIYLNPSIIPTALMGTAVIFVCFTMCALYSANRYWLYLGGSLSSGLSFLLILSFANIFFRSQLLFQVELYLGLIVMCSFVLYDTQLIIEKHRRGDKDFITHSLRLFVDLFEIFRHLLVILSQKEERSKRKSN